MSGHRHKDIDWEVCRLFEDRSNEKTSRRENDNFVIISLLLDLRDELKLLNRVFNCSNFLELPRMVRAIRRNTAKPRKSKTNG